MTPPKSNNSAWTGVFTGAETGMLAGGQASGRIVASWHYLQSQERQAPKMKTAIGVARSLVYFIKCTKLYFSGYLAINPSILCHYLDIYFASKLTIYLHLNSLFT